MKLQKKVEDPNCVGRSTGSMVGNYCFWITCLRKMFLGNGGGSPNSPEFEKCYAKNIGQKLVKKIGVKNIPQIFCIVELSEFDKSI